MPPPTKVYIVNDSGHDYSDAERFGELVVLSEGMVNKFSVTHMRRVLEQGLADSEPGDYILHSGPNVMNSVAAAIFAAKHGRINLLIFQTKANGNGRYVSRSLVFRRKKRRRRQKEPTE